MLDPHPRCTGDMRLLILLEQVLEIAGNVFPDIINCILDTINCLNQSLYCRGMVHCDLAQAHCNGRAYLHLKNVIPFWVKRPIDNQPIPPLSGELSDTLLGTICSESIIDCSDFIATNSDNVFHKTFFLSIHKTLHSHTHFIVYSHI